MVYLLSCSKIIATAAIVSLISTPVFAEGNDADIRSIHSFDFAAAAGRSAPTPGEAADGSSTDSASTTGRLVSTVVPRGGSDSARVGPEHLRSLVRRHADANGVPFAIADAVVRVESRYNPGASSKGNFGLMQIRLQTARGVGYVGGAAGLLNAETNARYGMRYLAQAFRMAGGDTCRTIMKYQSGHGATSMSGANRAYCSKVRTIVARS
jgi:hypothetical protein